MAPADVSVKLKTRQTSRAGFPVALLTEKCASRTLHWNAATTALDVELWRNAEVMDPVAVVARDEEAGRGVVADRHGLRPRRLSVVNVERRV